MISGFEAARFATVNAHVRALRSNLISDAVWHNLLDVSDVVGAIEILLQTSYAPEFQEYSPETGLEQVENRLLGRAAQNTRHLMSLMNGAVRNLFQVWWQHYELENLKSVFRGVQQQLPSDSIARLLVPLGEYTTLPWDSLIQELTVSNLIERLAQTHYINPLRNALPAYQRAQSLFPLEIALDIRYYRDVAAAIRKLGGDDEAAARRILGTRLDILNILWAFRHRLYYGMSAEEIVNYTLWHTFRTDTNLVREIALGANPRDIVQRVWGGAVDLSLLAGIEEPLRMMPWLELALERYWRQLALREMGGYPFKLGALLGYLVLSEIEFRDLITLLESKAMGWSSERMQQNLVRNEG